MMNLRKAIFEGTKQEYEETREYLIKVHGYEHFRDRQKNIFEEIGKGLSYCLNNEKKEDIK